MLKDTILKFLKLDGLIESLAGYIEARVELFKLEIREDVAKAMAKLSVFFILAFSFVIFLLFASLSVALWIGESLGLVLGFAIIAAAYFLITLMCFLFKKPISKSLEKTLLDITKKK